MAAPVSAGDVLAGKYRVEQILGEGGMGIVVSARHVTLDERVALKFLLPAALGLPEAVDRFLREARAAVRIKSEHVARVSDVGQLENGAPYIVMEFLDGMDLSAVLRAQGPLPIEEAVDYIAQTCEAIADAHALGIVHRDLKPANLMVVRRSDGSACVKVLDFGISKVVGNQSDSHGLTRTTAVLGSPLYMSPEQMMSPRDVDSRTDIWSIGTILYELLTGQTPFEADTLPALGVKIATEAYVPARNLRPEVPEALEWVIAGCLAKKRDQRFASVADVAQALGPLAPMRSRVSIERASGILRGSQHGAPGPASSGSAVAGAPSTFANWGQTSRSTPPVKRRSKGPLLAGAGLVVAAGAVAVVFAMRPAAPSSAAASAGSTAPSAARSSQNPLLPLMQPSVTVAPPPPVTPIETLAPATSAAPSASVARPAAPSASADGKAAGPAAHAGSPARPSNAGPAGADTSSKKPSNYDDM